MLRETRLGCEGIVVKLRCTLKLEFSRIVMMIESWVDPHDLSWEAFLKYYREILGEWVRSCRDVGAARFRDCDFYCS